MEHLTFQASACEMFHLNALGFFHVIDTESKSPDQKNLHQQQAGFWTVVWKIRGYSCAPWQQLTFYPGNIGYEHFHQSDS